jgi:CDP-diacylglycerol--serine O-phosphatidyltransferase
VLPLLLLIGLLAAFLVTQPWVTLSVLGLIYLGTIPLSYTMYKRRAAIEAEGRAAEPDDDDFDAGL